MFNGAPRRLKMFAACVALSVAVSTLLVVVATAGHGFGVTEWLGIALILLSGLAWLWHVWVDRRPMQAHGCVTAFPGSVTASVPKINNALRTVARNVERPDTRTWIASTRMSWRTFGDRVALTIRTVDDETEVAVLSWTPGWQIVDYGRNRANVRRLAAALGLQDLQWMDCATVTRHLDEVRSRSAQLDEPPGGPVPTEAV